MLPLSAAHLVETAPQGKHRHDVALTMLELSRGWQMRNPLEVRRQELRNALAGVDPRAAAVFTLEPHVALADQQPVLSPADFPPQWAELHGRLTSVMANVATMLEDADPPSAGPGPAVTRAWTDAYSAVANDAHGRQLSKDETQARAHEVLLTDLRNEVIQAARGAGKSDEQIDEWIENESQTEFGRAAHIGTLRTVLYHRLRNPADHWEPNDLLDMNFLSCGAAYADVAVVEKKFADYLRRARRERPANSIVVSTLSEGVRALN